MFGATRNDRAAHPEAAGLQEFTQQVFDGLPFQRNRQRRKPVPSDVVHQRPQVAIGEAEAALTGSPARIHP